MNHDGRDSSRGHVTISPPSDIPKALRATLDPQASVTIIPFDR
jgi:hypothetical protein